MKKMLFALLICLLTLTGCSVDAGEHQMEDDKLSVVTTIFPYYDFVRQLGGERVNVELILPAGKDTHSFEPVPRDIIRMESADLIIYNGGSVDSWTEDVLEAMEETVMAGRAMDWVDSVMEEHVHPEGEEAHHHHHDHEEEYDEHIWTSPHNAIVITEKITELLCEADSEGEEYYRSNQERYRAELERLDQLFHDVVEQGSRHLIVFGDKFPFRYLADAYGLEYKAAFPGCSTEADPAMSTMAYLIDLVQEGQIPVVYHVELSSHKVADAIAETAGVKTLLLHSCHNITREEFDQGVTYLELMEQNARNLEEGLR